MLSCSALNLQAQQTFHLSGQIKGHAVKYVVFNRFVNDDVKSDTVYIHNSKFQYKGVCKEPEFTNLLLPLTRTNNGQAQEFDFYIEPGIRNIYLQTDSISKSKIVGGITNEAYFRYQKENQKILEQVSNLTNQYISIESNTELDQTNDTLEALNGELEDLNDPIHTMDSQFISRTPNNYFNLSLVDRELKNEIAIEKVAPLFEMISPAIKKTKYGREVQQKIKIAKQYTIGNSVPDIIADDSTAKEQQLSAMIHRNKFTLIDLWASWCIPCQQEFPTIRKAYNNFHSKGCDIYSISMDFAKEAWVGALKRLQLPWTNVWTAHLPSFYQVNAIPFNLLVDSNGKIVARNLRGQKLEETLQKFLK